LQELITEVDHSQNEIPYGYTLSQNYPNPFNPSTTIIYSVPEGIEVTIKVFDVLGRDVTILVNEQKEAGTHTIVFDASNLTSGVYFYQLTGGNFQEIRKMILLR
jgi:hypothetical protein